MDKLAEKKGLRLPHPLFKEIANLEGTATIYGAVVKLARECCPGERLETASDQYDNFYVLADSGRVFYEEGEILPEPPREDFKSSTYKAGPAADGKIHRLHCRCGELPDGIIYQAHTEAATYFRCSECVPKGGGR